MIVDMGDARDPLAPRLIARRSAASKKGWRSRRRMEQARAETPREASLGSGEDTADDR